MKDCGPWSEFIARFIQNNFISIIVNEVLLEHHSNDLL
jgi:hypothetical protein